MLVDCLVWSFYNVLLPAALPISLVWSGLFLLGRRRPLFDIIGDGQLCFFSIALLAVTVNDIANLSDEKKRTPWATSYLRFAEPSSYMIIIITVFVFGLIVSLDGTANTPAIKRRLTTASILLTVASLATIYYWRGNLELFR
jgi:hypothetical protein